MQRPEIASGLDNRAQCTAVAAIGDEADMFDANLKKFIGADGKLVGIDIDSHDAGTGTTKVTTYRSADSAAAGSDDND
jgi:hypothetical protein